VSGIELLEEVPGLAIPGPCLHYPDQAQLHPILYLNGLLDGVLARGGRVWTHTRVSALHGDGPFELEVDGVRAIKANAVVIATNTPFNYLLALHSKQAAYRSYVVAVRAPVLKAPPALWWDLEDPFHYVRFCESDSGMIALIGGEDHKTGQDDVGADGRYERLIDWARVHVPGVGPVVDRWSGQIMETIDGLAYIGRVEPDRDVFVVSGDSGNGMTHGVIAGIMLPEAIRGDSSAWDAAYDPTRVRRGALRRFASENWNVLLQYGDWAGPLATRQEPEEGGSVVWRGLHPVAIYRDSSGRVCERSAVCPHLGCVVAWNAAERSWDCPCHGSRFSPSGEVLHGPASRGLASVHDATDPRDEGDMDEVRDGCDPPDPSSPTEVLRAHPR
jgi:nitrite reductase/ring-hydroxylating ferredoxin subunit